MGQDTDGIFAALINKADESTQETVTSQDRIRRSAQARYGHLPNGQAIADRALHAQQQHQGAANGCAIAAQYLNVGQFYDLLHPPSDLQKAPSDAERIMDNLARQVANEKPLGLNDTYLTGGVAGYVVPQSADLNAAPEIPVTPEMIAAGAEVYRDTQSWMNGEFKVGITRFYRAMHAVAPVDLISNGERIWHTRALIAEGRVAELEARYGSGFNQQIVPMTRFVEIQGELAETKAELATLRKRVAERDASAVWAAKRGRPHGVGIKLP